MTAPTCVHLHPIDELRYVIWLPVVGVTVSWRRAKGGGWVSRDTGEHIPSEWGISAVAEKIVRLVKKPESQYQDRAEMVELRIEQWKDKQWRDMLNRSEYLSAQQGTNPAAYVRFFEVAARECRPDVANPQELTLVGR